MKGLWRSHCGAQWMKTLRPLCWEPRAVTSTVLSFTGIEYIRNMIPSCFAYCQEICFEKCLSPWFIYLQHFPFFYAWIPCYGLHDRQKDTAWPRLGFPSLAWAVSLPAKNPRLHRKVDMRYIAMWGLCSAVINFQHKSIHSPEMEIIILWRKCVVAQVARIYFCFLKGQTYNPLTPWNVFSQYTIAHTAVQPYRLSPQC